MTDARILAKPEDEPIVIDNPEFALDVLNDTDLNQPSVSKVQRKCSELSQILVFDSKGNGTSEFLTFNLEPNTPVSLFLHKEETQGNDPGEEISISVQNGIVTFEAKDGSELAPDSTRKTKFRIKTPKPKRGIFSVVFTEKNGSQKPFKLEKNGRHIVFLVPGSPILLAK